MQTSFEAELKDGGHPREKETFLLYYDERRHFFPPISIFFSLPRQENTILRPIVQKAQKNPEAGQRL